MVTTHSHTTVDLLRHGQLVTEDVFCAHQDTPISDEGRENLHKITKDGEWDVIFSSPQRRCCEFAETLANAKNCPLVLDKNFKEMDFGDWIGLSNKTLWANHKADFQQLWENPLDFVAPNGESMQVFIQRVVEGFHEVLLANQGKTILFVTHGGVIRSLLAYALDINAKSILKFNIGYAHMSRLHFYPDGNFSLQYLLKNA